jgi:putative ABC transport system substrate-binding protein
MIGRRTFIAGAAVWPVVTRAQQAAVPVVGFLGFTGPNSPALNAFRRGLAEAGYVEGQNVMIEYRAIIFNNPAAFQGLVADLVRRQPAVIVSTGGLFPLRAARSATSTIPIVFVSGADPVTYGFVASLNRPGGTVTGISLLTSGLEGKKLNLLLELIPQATTVAFLSGPSNSSPVFEDDNRNMLAAGDALGREIVVLEVRSEFDFEAAFATFVERRAGALVVGDSLLFFTPRNRDKIVGLAAAHKIPTIYPNRGYAFAGGLMSYGADGVSVYRQLGLNSDLLT